MWPKHLPAMKDLAQQVSIGSQAFGRFVDRQSFAHDQAHGCPIDRCLVSIAFARVHASPPNELCRRSIVARLRGNVSDRNT
jgi:hypothetical protein